MKKLLLTIAAALALLPGTQAQSANFPQAAAETENHQKTYTDDLDVTVGGTVIPTSKASVNIEWAGTDKINVQLKNFILELEGSPMYVGNINVPDIPLTDSGSGYYSFDVKQQLATITDGDLPNVPAWVGPIVIRPNPLPINMSGKISEESLFCTLDLEATGLKIHVVFGKDDFGSSIHSALSEKQMQTTNVYTLQGILVKGNVEKAHALDGLQKGIYIVDGKKVVKE